MQSSDAYQERFQPLCTWMPPTTKAVDVVRNERTRTAFALVNGKGLKVKQHPRRLKSVDSRKPPDHPPYKRLSRVLTSRYGWQLSVSRGAVSGSAKLWLSPIGGLAPSSRWRGSEAVSPPAASHVAPSRLAPAGQRRQWRDVTSGSRRWRGRAFAPGSSQTTPPPVKRGHAPTADRHYAVRAPSEQAPWWYFQRANRPFRGADIDQIHEMIHSFRSMDATAFLDPLRRLNKGGLYIDQRRWRLAAVGLDGRR